MNALMSQMTSAEVGEAANRGALVVIPVGAFEQHGPAMPMATDTIRAEGVAERVAAAMPARVVIGPSVPIGISPHHLAFPGTITLRTSTFGSVLRDYVDSLAHHGFRRFLVITGHGGNNSALGVLAQDLFQDRPELEFAWTPVTTLAKSAIADLKVSEVHGHCGEAETAQMLDLAPHLVRSDLLAAGTTRLDELDGFARLVRASGPPSVAFGYDRLSANGVLGDPRRVTPDDGRAILDQVVSHLVEFLEEWLTT